jgi:hypothetical protein
MQILKIFFVIGIQIGFIWVKKHVIFYYTSVFRMKNIIDFENSDVTFLEYIFYFSVSTDIKTQELSKLCMPKPVEWSKTIPFVCLLYCYVMYGIMLFSKTTLFKIFGT